MLILHNMHKQHHIVSKILKTFCDCARISFVFIPQQIKILIDLRICKSGFFRVIDGKNEGILKRDLRKKLAKNSIRDGISTALGAAYTVDTVYTALHCLRGTDS